MDAPVYFEFPESTIQGIPLEANGEHLNFGLIEVGCHARHKVGQLNSKRELVYKFWGDTYRRQGISWNPRIFRTLAHYDPCTTDALASRHDGIDAVVHYAYIAPEKIAELHADAHDEILRVVKRKMQRAELDQILAGNDAERLHALITGSRIDLSTLRGKLAELLVLRDIAATIRTQHVPLNLFQNGTIKYFNRRFRNGTEVDGIMTFYGDAPFYALLDKLNSLDHMRVLRR